MSSSAGGGGIKTKVDIAAQQRKKQKEDSALDKKYGQSIDHLHELMSGGGTIRDADQAFLEATQDELKGLRPAQSTAAKVSSRLTSLFSTATAPTTSNATDAVALQAYAVVHTEAANARIAQSMFHIMDSMIPAGVDCNFANRAKVIAEIDGTAADSSEKKIKAVSEQALWYQRHMLKLAEAMDPPNTAIVNLLKNSSSPLTATDWAKPEIQAAVLEINKNIDAQVKKIVNAEDSSSTATSKVLLPEATRQENLRLFAEKINPTNPPTHPDLMTSAELKRLKDLGTLAKKQSDILAEQQALELKYNNTDDLIADLIAPKPTKPTDEADFANFRSDNLNKFIEKVKKATSKTDTISEANKLLAVMADLKINDAKLQIAISNLNSATTTSKPTEEHAKQALVAELETIVAEVSDKQVEVAKDINYLKEMQKEPFKKLQRAVTNVSKNLPQDAAQNAAKFIGAENAGADLQKRNDGFKLLQDNMVNVEWPPNAPTKPAQAVAIYEVLLALQDPNIDETQKKAYEAAVAEQGNLDRLTNAASGGQLSAQSKYVCEAEVKSMQALGIVDENKVIVVLDPKTDLADEAAVIAKQDEYAGLENNIQLDNQRHNSANIDFKQAPNALVGGMLQIAADNKDQKHFWAGMQGTNIKIDSAAGAASYIATRASVAKEEGRHLQNVEADSKQRLSLGDRQTSVSVNKKVAEGNKHVTYMLSNLLEADKNKVYDYMVNAFSINNSADELKQQLANAEAIEALSVGGAKPDKTTVTQTEFDDAKLEAAALKQANLPLLLNDPHARNNPGKFVLMDDPDNAGKKIVLNIFQLKKSDGTTATYLNKIENGKRMPIKNDCKLQEQIADAMVNNLKNESHKNWRYHDVKTYKVTGTATAAVEAKTKYTGPAPVVNKPR